MRGSYFNTPGRGWQVRALSECLVIQIQYVFRCCLTTYSQKVLMCRHQEGSKVCGLCRCHF